MPRPSQVAAEVEQFTGRLAYLLDWYDDLRAANPVGMTVNPIPHSEIKDYRDLYDLPMDAFDVQTLRALDGVWLKCLPKHPSKE